MPETIRCSECKKPIVEMTKYQHWLAIFNFLNFLFMENYIEQDTRDSMLDSLMTLQAFAFEDSEK
jgi:hypothetical protein